MSVVAVLGASILAGSGVYAVARPTSVLRAEVVISESRFHPATMTVPVGSFVHFVVRNIDPIDHELIIGDAAVQDRHERGTEAHHHERPGEASIPAEATRSTNMRFDRPGVLLFGCHLRGHWDYGMRGTIEVLP